ncbi:MAG: hypothetical protein IJP98_04670 [Clostridia bacterium]|nr:hypothetical protein [Clostridia bacterium]
MKQKEALTTEAIDALLRPCTKVLPEGFRIDLSLAPMDWNNAIHRFGGRTLFRGCAGRLAAWYRETFGNDFLFSVPCMTFELRYHADAYLWTQGLRTLRHVTTLLFPKREIERACRSVEIDTGDVYRWSQRLMFRYFFGILPRYRRTERDPYAVPFRGRYVRIPLMRR